MMVNNALIDNLAHLARLQFSEDEKAELQKDLQSMIAFVEKLNEIDTTGVQPLLHMSSEINVLRSDEVKNSITHEDALLNAPVPDEVFFKAPKVIKAPRHEGN